MLLGLNDCAGKQPDTSWIWDVDFASLTGLVTAPVVCGNRAADLAVRLKYAYWLEAGHDADLAVEFDPVRAFKPALARTPPGQPLGSCPRRSCWKQLRRWLSPGLRQRGLARAGRTKRGGGPEDLSGILPGSDVAATHGDRGNVETCAAAAGGISR